MGDDLRAFCGALEIERPIVLGNSFGGMVAMSYATRHPDGSGQAGIEQHRRGEPARSIAGDVEEAGRGGSARSSGTVFRQSRRGNCRRFSEKCFPFYNRVPAGPEFTKRSVMNLELMVDYFKQSRTRSTFCPTLKK